MEFEFERRRVIKEDIQELIFREILEYHPQLLKDYMNGTERTNFLYPRLKLNVIIVLFFFFFWGGGGLFFKITSSLMVYCTCMYVCSAVDQFRKQFAHLEENGGKSAPAIPLDRKHVSLPRYI